MVKIKRTACNFFLGIPAKIIGPVQGALIRTGQKTFFAKVDGPDNFGRLWLASQTKTKQKRQKWTSHSYFCPVLICAPCILKLTPLYPYPWRKSDLILNLRYGHDVEDGDVQVHGLNANNSLGHVNPTWPRLPIPKWHQLPKNNNAAKLSVPKRTKTSKIFKIFSLVHWPKMTKQKSRDDISIFIPLCVLIYEGISVACTLFVLFYSFSTTKNSYFLFLFFKFFKENYQFYFRFFCSGSIKKYI